MHSMWGFGMVQEHEKPKANTVYSNTMYKYILKYITNKPVCVVDYNTHGFVCELICSIE